jgi:hypothetical protein
LRDWGGVRMDIKEWPGEGSDAEMTLEVARGLPSWSTVTDLTLTQCVAADVRSLVRDPPPALQTLSLTGGVTDESMEAVAALGQVTLRNVRVSPWCEVPTSVTVVSSSWRLPSAALFAVEDDVATLSHHQADALLDSLLHAARLSAMHLCGETDAPGTFLIIMLRIWAENSWSGKSASVRWGMARLTELLQDIDDQGSAQAILALAQWTVWAAGANGSVSDWDAWDEPMQSALQTLFQPVREG